MSVTRGPATDAELAPGRRDVTDRAQASGAARWDDIAALFDEAVAVPPEQRAAWLATRCADDHELEAEVRSLLGFADDARLRTAVAQAVATLVSERARPGTRLGPYRLVELLGEGGMGAVWRAMRDDREYHREVAIKVLRSELGAPDAVARFREERQILAALDHPGIVRLLDGGTTEAGLPYLVMEYIQGRPLAEVARSRSVRGRVELMIRVAEAVQYAHQRLVVHRDLKPGNVLVDAAGAPRLLDFGIARLLDETLPREARTRTGMALLTPEYASPEQARGEPATVASDVYGLGAVLYELLVGVPPQRVSANPLETLRAICEQEPTRPSLAAPALRRELRGDLDNIVLRALQKQPGARYPSAAMLADDLRAFLAGRPVVARAATPGYRARKFVRRNRGKLVIASAIAVTLATAAIVSIVQGQRARVAARIADRQTRQLLIEQAVGELAADRPSRALPYLVEVLRRGEDTPAIRFLIAEASRPFAQQIGATFDAPEGLFTARWSPDGAAIAIGGNTSLRILDPELRPRVTFETGEDVYEARFALAGGHVVAPTASAYCGWALTPPRVISCWPRGAAGVVALIPPAVRAALDEIRGTGVWDAALFPGAAQRPTDGSFPLAPGTGTGTASVDGAFAYVGHDGAIERWRSSSWTLDRRVAAEHPDLLHLHATRSGLLLAFHADGAIGVWDLGLTRQCVFGRHGATAGVFAFDRDERVAVTGDATGDLWVWELATCRQRAVLRGHRAGITAVAMSSDGALAASAGADNMFRVWDTTRGEPIMTIEAFAAAGSSAGAIAGTKDVAFSPDDRSLVTVSATAVKRWHVTRAPLIDVIPVDFGLYAARWSPDGSRLAIVGFGAAVQAGDRRITLEAARDDAPWYAVDWSPDGTAMVMAGRKGAWIVAATGAVLRSLAVPPGTVNGAAYSPAGDRIVTASPDAARVWDARTGTLLTTLPHPARVMAAAWSGDGRLLATAGWDRVVRIWEAATGRLVRSFDGATTQFLSVSFSPDGAILARGGHDGEVSLWRVRSGERLASLEGHTGPVTTVAWSPDGALLATTGDDQSTRLWEPRTGRQLARYATGETMDASWSRAGTQLVTVSHHGLIRTWSVARDARPAAEIAAFAATRSPWRLVGTRLVRAW